MSRLCLVILVSAIAILPAASASAAQDGGSQAAGSPRSPASSAPSRPPSCMGRTDVAALDEYCGALPDAANRRTPGPPLEKVLPKKVVEQLKRAGPIGDLLLSLPAAAMQRRNGAEGLDAEALLRTGRLGTRRKPASNPIKAAAGVASDGALNAAFGSVLLMSTFGLAGSTWVRYRRRRSF